MLGPLEVSRELLQLLTASELLHKCVCALSEGHNRVVQQIRVPLDGWSYEARLKAFAHARLMKLARNSDGEHSLLIRSNVVVWICCAIVELYVWKSELLRHLHKGNGVNKW